MCLGIKASTPLASVSLSHRMKKVPERSRREVRERSRKEGRILVLWIILVSEKNFDSFEESNVLYEDDIITSNWEIESKNMN